MYHRIKFYPKVSTRGDYGDSTDTWPTATILTRGEIRYSGGGYSSSNEEKFYSKFMELTVRYQSAIVESMRVQVDETVDRYRISYREVIGRNEALKLTLEKINL